LLQWQNDLDKMINIKINTKNK